MNYLADTYDAGRDHEHAQDAHDEDARRLDAALESEAVQMEVARLRKLDGEIWERVLRESAQRAVSAETRLSRLTGAVVDAIAKIRREDWALEILQRGLEDSK